MEQLLAKIEGAVQDSLNETIDTFINKLVEIGIDKNNIRTYTIEDKTEVSIVIPEAEKTIDISINVKNCKIV